MQGNLISEAVTCMGTVYLAGSTSIGTPAKTHVLLYGEQHAYRMCASFIPLSGAC